ncbi:hypothetical protein BGZ65_005809 [Modicella reniformis]|uniref:CUE domain-containing protein n=1 Tax=Modicella reniformis TaxID=1440133 RepID=A0A9P6IN75_9FUNG|nr:hypothetical protein BGZ65_005809 [Modicella reniformis]
MSTRYARRPASMMAIPNQQQAPGLSRGGSGGSGSNISSGSQSSSLGSVSAHSVAEPVELKDSSATSSLTSELKQHQDSQQKGEGNEEEETKETKAKKEATSISKDEVYSPLTSPIMIPIGGFPASKTSNNNGYRTNVIWTNPQSPSVGLTRPLTYAGPSTSTLSSNASLVTSPTTVVREQQQSPQQSPQQGSNFAGLERNVSGTTTELPKKKAEKSHRYSTASFSSIGSFARSQNRSSKKDRRKELIEQEQQQQQQRQQQQQQQQLDQRFSVSSTPANANANEYWTEQSLDKLSDVLPHVDRDRLSIYLQRAYGDEMVAIGLAMSDLRSGQL